MIVVFLMGFYLLCMCTLCVCVCVCVYFIDWVVPARQRQRKRSQLIEIAQIDVETQGNVAFTSEIN